MDYIKDVDVSHNVLREQRERYEKMWKLRNASTNLPVGTTKIEKWFQGSDRTSTIICHSGKTTVEVHPEGRKPSNGRSRCRFGEVANLVVRKLAYLFCQRRTLIMLQLAYFQELQLVDRKFQVVLE